MNTVSFVSVIYFLFATGRNRRPTACIHFSQFSGRLFQHYSYGIGGGPRCSQARASSSYGHAYRVLPALYPEHLWCDPLYPLDMGRRHRWRYTGIPHCAYMLLYGKSPVYLCNRIVKIRTKSRDDTFPKRAKFNQALY